jgi:uncharacterized protein involved in exopolysaccharide biosynthesis
MHLEREGPVGDDINLADYWEVIAGRRRLIGAIVGASFLASVAVSLILPKTYTATASLLPPQQDGMAAAMLAPQMTGALGGIAGSFLGLKSPADLWAGILRSQAVEDSIIERFGLREAYGAETIEDARRALETNFTVKKTVEQIIMVSVEDRDPRKAADMANAFVEELDNINKRVLTTSGGRTRVFLEKRLADARAELARLEDALKDFQEANAAVSLDEQGKAVIESAAALKAGLIAKEVELKTLLSYAEAANPQAEILRAEIDELSARLKEFEVGGADSGIFIPTGRMPALANRYVKLVRDLKVQEALFELLTQQYEMARIQEAKDSPTVQVLAAARAPEKRSSPKRTLIVASSTIVSIFIAIAAALTLHSFGYRGRAAGGGL